jgi:hypothetical protein
MVKSLLKLLQRMPQRTKCFRRKLFQFEFLILHFFYQICHRERNRSFRHFGGNVAAAAPGRERRWRRSQHDRKPQIRFRQTGRKLRQELTAFEIEPVAGKIGRVRNETRNEQNVRRDPVPGSLLRLGSTHRSIFPRGQRAPPNSGKTFDLQIVAAGNQGKGRCLWRWSDIECDLRYFVET